MNKFNNPIQRELFLMVSELVEKSKLPDWPKNAGWAFRRLAEWWANHRLCIGGPGELLAILVNASESPIIWQPPEFLEGLARRRDSVPVSYDQDSEAERHLVNWPPTVEDLGDLIARFQELEVTPPGHFPRPQDAAGSDHKLDQDQPTTRVKKGGKTNLIEAVVRVHLDKHGIEGITQANDAAWIVDQVKQSHGVTLTDRLVRKWLASAGRKLILEKTISKNREIDMTKVSHVAGLTALRVKGRPN